jgi:hypothetical protein
VPALTAEPPVWATACFGEAPDTLPVDLAALGEHTAQCTAANGRLVALRCGAARLLGFVTARLVTTGALLVALGAALLMWT